MDTNSEDRIRERVHQIWETEGRPKGKADDHWRTASREIAADDGRAQTGMPQRRAERLLDQRLSEIEGDPAAGREAPADPRV